MLCVAEVVGAGASLSKQLVSFECSVGRAGGC